MNRESIARRRRLPLILSAVIVLAALSSSSRMHATETVIHSFTGPDGAQPTAGLTPDGSGNYFGTTLGGGSTLRYGTVFELSPASGGGWTQTVLYNFTNGADGGQPAAGLVRDSSGNLYGTTSGGGGCTFGSGCGVVFKLSQSGGVWTETVLYTFTGGADGGTPNGVILDASGNLFGTTGGGGSGGNGVVFELSPNSNGTWTETVIHTFTGGTNGGRSPNGSLVFDSVGRLYGTTTFSGNGGGGLVFRLTPNGTGGWTAGFLHNFSGRQDGAVPNGGLVLDAAGHVYGTAQAGGNLTICNRFGCGVVFRLSRKAGGGWTETVIHTFSRGTDGGVPLAGLIMDSSGNLYGTTSVGGDPSVCGGQGGCGVVFKLSPGSTGYTETVMYTFSGSTDGEFPGSPLFRDSSGNLFGTTFDGGTLSDCSGVGCGVVFEVTP
jgi:uncharacterized repeat protein (TIGR03803 family)